MIQYLKQFDIADIHEFASSAEFEKTFFMKLANPSSAAKPARNPLASVSEDIVKFLNVSNFCEQDPFSEAQILTNVSLDGKTLQRSTSTKVFGKTVTEITANNITMDSFLVSETKSAWDNLLRKVSLGPTTETVFVCAQNDKKEIWCLEISATAEAQGIVLKMSDITREVMKSLGKKVSEKDPKADETKPIDLIIFKENCIKANKVRDWVTRTAALMNKAKLWSAVMRPRFVATRYEDDPKEKAEFNHPFIDDLICFPLDRAIFLQKIEIVLGLPKKVSPSFLFVQAVNDDVDMAKKVPIEYISDLGLVMTNPAPLSPQTPARFYFKFPGQKTLLDVRAKVQISKPHPILENHFLVYMTFFGLNKNMYKEVRQYLSRDSAYKYLLNSDPANYTYNPDNIFLTEDQKIKKTVAVIDFDENSRKNVVDYVKKEIGNTDVVFDDSYFGFFKKYLDRNSEWNKSMPSTAADYYSDNVSILVNSADLNLQMSLKPAAENDKLLGHDANKLFGSPQEWLTMFDEDAKKMLMECITLLGNMSRVNKNINLKTASGELRSVSVDLVFENNNQLLRIAFKPPELKPVPLAQLAHIDTLDAIVIDNSLLPAELDAFMTGLQEATAKAGIKTPEGGPRVIVTANENQKVDVSKLLKSRIFGLLYKPLEIRRLLYLVTQAIESPFSLYVFDNVGWKEDIIPAKIAREGKVIELSEFGATLKTAQPLRPGSMLYLFQSIYSNAPDHNLCVRVIHSEEDSKEKGSYLNYVIYFGITDAFLKFTRAYIREAYANLKSKEGAA